MANTLRPDWPASPLTLLDFDLVSKFWTLARYLNPSNIVTLATLPALYHYSHEPTYVRWSALLWAKLCVATCLVTIHVAEALLTSQLHCLVTAASALSVGSLAYMEHRRAINPSFLFAMLLVVDILSFSGIKELLRPTQLLSIKGSVAGAVVVLKVIMVALQNRTKKQLILDDDLCQEMGEVSCVDIFGEFLSLLLNPIFVSGYGSRAFMRGVNNIDPKVHPETLLLELKKSWVRQQVPKPVRPSGLFFACLKTWKHILLPLLFSRLALTALKCSHAFVLRHVLVIVESQHDMERDRTELYATFGAACAIFLASALVQEHSSHLLVCYTARLRGGLVALQLDKLQRLAETDAEKSASAALVSSDIDGIVDNIPNCLAILSSTFELGIASSLLSWFIDAPASIIYLPIILSSSVCYLLAQMMMRHFANWNSSLNSRVSGTSGVIQQLTAIKMIGLGPTICEFLQALRIQEARQCRPLGFLTAAIATFTTIANLGVPVAAIGAAMSANFFNGRMSAAKVFPLLCVIFPSYASFPHIITSISILKNLAPCFARIQAFLCLPEREDCRIAFCTSAADPTSSSQDAICFNQSDISPHRTVSAILRGVNARLSEGSITVVIGPHGAGKSTFLRAILGDCELLAGSIQVNEADIGYFGEQVRLREATIRESIIGTFPYEAERYAAVIRACFLEEDLERLPGGDKYNVGFRGSNLSDGQRQRIGAAKAAYAQHKVTLLDDMFRFLDLDTAICILYQLCGKNSILRQAGCTVVVVTSLPECLEIADQLVILDGLGKATLDHGFRNSPQRQRAMASLKTLNQDNNPPVVDEKKQQAAIYRYLRATAVLDGSRSDQQSISNWELFSSAISTIGQFKAILHALIVLILSAFEVMPYVYLRIWIELYPEDLSLYFGYAFISMAAPLIIFATYFITFVLLSPRISVDLHKTLVQTVGQSTLAFLEQANVGKLLNLFSEDTLTISKDLPKAVLKILHAGFKSTILICIVLSGNKYIAWTSPVILVFVLVRIRPFCSLLGNSRRFGVPSKVSLCSFFMDTAAGLTHLKSPCQKKKNMEDGMGILTESQICYYSRCIASKKLRLHADFLGVGFAAMLLAPALFTRGASTVTSVGLAYHALIGLPRVLDESIAAFFDLDTPLQAVRRLLEFKLYTPLENSKQPVKVPPSWPTSGAVELRNAFAYYTSIVDHPPTLSNVSLSIRPGQHIGISGRHGSGKSSLIIMMLGFIRHEGIIRIDGIEISSITPDTLRSRLITITQEPTMLEGTVRTNLLPSSLAQADRQQNTGGDRQQDAELERLLNRLGIWMPLVNKGGLGAEIDDVGYSKADLQLLCIARGVLKQRETGRKVVLLDDCTSYLNTEREKIANDIIQEAFRGCTVLRTSSRQSGLEGASFVVHIRRGEVVDPSEASYDSESDEEE